MPPEVTGPQTPNAPGAQPPMMMRTTATVKRTIVPMAPLPASPAPGPLETGVARPMRTRPKGMLTLAALAGSLGLGLATVLVVQESLTTGEQVILVSIASLVAFVGLVPVRWGLYVWAMCTVAFFGLTIYNQMNPAGTIFQLYRGSSYSFAVLMPMLGVFVGGVVQGLYRVVGGR